LDGEAQDPSCGFVRASFETGSLLLMNHEGEHFRLVWNEEVGANASEDPTRHRDADKDTAQQTRRRALPPGKYMLRSYRIARRDEQGAWMLSVTGERLQKVVVEKGRETVVEVPEAVHCEVGAKRHGDQLGVQMNLTGMEHAGLTVYHGGVRVPAFYVLHGKDAGPPHEGRINYG